MKIITIELLVKGKRKLGVSGIFDEESLRLRENIVWDAYVPNIPKVENKAGRVSFSEQYENIIKIAESKYPNKSYKIETLVEEMKNERAICKSN
ncbi:MAG: hypothetical protein WC438_01205 [Candidatus Pacearchaeota archaeon]